LLPIVSEIRTCLPTGNFWASRKGTQEPQGARASADLYSLIETAKANRLEPYRYLRYLFEKLPFAENEQDYAALLPMRLKAEDLALSYAVTGV
jgi:transposase